MQTGSKDRTEPAVRKVMLKDFFFVWLKKKNAPHVNLSQHYSHTQKLIRNQAVVNKGAQLHVQQ